MCGDSFLEPTPRNHELGGKFGDGEIVKSYENIGELDVGVKITTNHFGYFSFDICNLDEFEDESEECFSENKLDFLDGGQRYDIDSRTGMINVSLSIPEDLECDHCVLRWKYTTANNWGKCDDGSSQIGCGVQETFINCADIEIY